MKIKIASTVENQILTVVLEGRLDAYSVGEFDAYMGEKLGSGIEKTVIDMTQVDFISSAGLRSLIKVKKALKKKPVVLRNPAATVIEVLNLAGILDAYIIERR